jgi:Uma2 family endonuclease
VIPRGWAHTRPDWVCEILSPGHEKRDLVDKIATLQRAGVPYYWIVDRVKKKLLLHRLEREQYIVQTALPGETIFEPPFEACELRTAVLFGDEDDEE